MRRRLMSTCCRWLTGACVVAADLQMVNITLRVLSKPDVAVLPLIFKVRSAPQVIDFRR